MRPYHDVSHTRGQLRSLLMVWFISIPRIYLATAVNVALPYLDIYSVLSVEHWGLAEEG